MRSDLFDNINPLPLFEPKAASTDNTAFVSSIIDTAGYESCTLVIVTGTDADADATFAVTMEHGDDSALADTAAPATTDLLGTLAQAGYTFANDYKTRKLGYVGSKRYVRMTVTPTNNTGNVFLAGVAILGHPRNKPTANPPA
jgi:hypothetical protein